MRHRIAAACLAVLAMAGFSMGAGSAFADVTPRLGAERHGPISTPSATITGEGSSGPVSGMCVRIVGATVCRLLAEFLGDVVNVASYGAVADGSDETAKIQAAITAGIGKTVYIPRRPGPYRVTQLVVPSNTRLWIDGTLKLADNAIGNVLSVSSEPATSAVDNVVIEGTGVIDGNRSRAGITPLALACVHAYTVTNFRARGLTLQNCKNYPINVWNKSKNVYLSYLTLQDSGSSAECANRVENCHADHLTIRRIDDYGFAFYGGIVGGTLTNSTSMYNKAGGVTVLADGLPSGGTSDGSSDIIISGNEFAYNATAGVHIQNDAPSTGLHRNITVTHNLMHHNNQSGLPPYGGIFARSINGFTAALNQIHDDGKPGAAGVASYGVFLGANLDGVSVLGNRIQREGIGSGGAGVGIGVSSDARAVLIQGNTIRDDQTVKTMANGLSGALGDGTEGRVEGNIISGTIGANDNLVYGNDTIREAVWKDYTPTLSAAGGSFGAATVAAQYAYDGRTLRVSAQVGVTSVGTATGPLRIGMPAGLTLPVQCTGVGRENAAGKFLAGVISPGDAFMSLTNIDGTAPYAANTNMSLTLGCRAR